MRAGRLVAPFAVLLCLLASACDDGAPTAESASGRDSVAAASDPDPDPEAVAYEAFLYGSIEDTLRGAARFGRVWDRRSDVVEDVIELPLPDGFMGGLYLVRHESGSAEPGTYPFADATADSASTPEGWSIVFRRGLSTRLQSTGGRIELEAVTDTLWVGTFDAQLHGTVADATGRVLGNDVRARGRFRAEPGNVGFLLGL